MSREANENRTILEPARELNVCAKADVVVVGGGPGGVGAAVAAARNGARTILVERYGHLGGMATGGLVIIIPHMSAGTRELQIGGICQEWVDRLDALGGAIHPPKEDLGSDDPNKVAYWKRYIWGVEEGRVRQTVYIDPELLKCVLNDMVTEANIKLYLHSWGAGALVEDNTVKGVVFESKSGRQAILGQIIIDATGDGDLLPSAGAEFDGRVDHTLRNSQLATVYRMGNADYSRYADFKEADPKRHMELLQELHQIIGFRTMPHASARNDVVWFNNWILGLDALNVEDLTAVELKVRKAIIKVHEFMVKNIPGFERAFILDTASQVGTRGSRRLIGEYTVTSEDVHSGRTYEDTIATFPHVSKNIENFPLAHIPYRALVPRTVDGLLVAGRHFSSDLIANNLYNWIPHCVAIGEAAGTAAALAVTSGVSARKVDVRALRDRLITQGVPL